MPQVLVIKSLLFLTGSLIKLTNAITEVLQVKKKQTIMIYSTDKLKYCSP